jgi:hypothetical protein
VNSRRLREGPEARPSWREKKFAIAKENITSIAKYQDISSFSFFYHQSEKKRFHDPRRDFWGNDSGILGLPLWLALFPTCFKSRLSPLSATFPRPSFTRSPKGYFWLFPSKRSREGANLGDLRSNFKRFL